MKSTAASGQGVRNRGRPVFTRDRAAAITAAIRMNGPAGERLHAPVLFMILVLIGSAVLFARNPIAIAHASMYAEDGVWTSLIYQTGGFAGYLNARPDYLMIGNMALLHTSITINHLIFGQNNITHLPAVIAVVSYVFFAAVAVLPAVALKSYLPLSLRLLLGALLLLLPVGLSAHEIFGRVVNTGFAFVFVATMIILWRETFRSVPFRAEILALDAVILVCCATNPIAIGIAGVYLAFRLAVVRGRSMNDWLLAAGLLPIAIVNAIGIITVPTSQGEGALSIGGFLYTGVARPLLYPLIFPWYDHLSHPVTVILGSLLIGLFLVGLRLTPHKTGLGLVLFAAALTTVATALQRPGFAAHLSGYASSFPDRYYFAQNLLVLTAVVWTADACLRSAAPRMKTAGRAIVAVLMLIYGLHPQYLFDWKMKPVNPTFEEQLRQGQTLENDSEFMKVDIFPANWAALYPARFRPEP